MDFPVSDYLDEVKPYLGEELADRLPDEDAIEQALDGSAVPGEEDKAKKLVGKAYEELKYVHEGAREQRRRELRSFQHTHPAG